MILKVCFIIHSLGIGGMERVASLLANHIQGKSNVQVHLMLIGRDRLIEYEIDSSIKIHIPEFAFRKTHRALDTFRTMRFIRKSVGDIDPDVVLSFGEYWNNLVMLSLTGKRRRIFLADRSQPGKNLGRIHNRLRNSLYPKASGLIVQTSQAKSIAEKRKWNQKIVVISNPILPRHSNHDDSKSGNYILTVGRLIPSKNIDHLIHIFKELDDPNWKLLIIGGNAKNMNLIKDYSKLIKDLGLEDQVSLLGEVRNVNELYDKSRIFAFCSSSEGFPNSLAEAMQSGLASVAYDCDAGPRDLIEDGESGFLVPLFDKELFKKRLKQLMESAELRDRLGTNARIKMKSLEIDLIGDEYFKCIAGS